MRILILEDEAIIAESLFQLLRLLDYDPCHPVATPADAIDLIDHDPPDLVILELNLQKGSGLELIKYIDEHELNIPFIVLTADSDVQTIASVKKYRPGAYLVKPFRRESLFAAIELLSPDELEQHVEPAGDHEIFLKTGSRYEKLDLHRLVYLKASGKYTELHFAFGKRLIRMPLYAFLEENSNVRLLRVHKTYAINPEFISSYAADELMLDKQRIPIGRFFMPQVHHYLRGRGQTKKNEQAGRHSEK